MKEENPQQDGFTAEELGEASIYEDATQMAQQMRRGDESKGDPNERDITGATHFKDTEEGRTDKDTVPHAKDTKNTDTTLKETMSSFEKKAKIR